MFRRLFPRLTDAPRRGEALFAAAVAEARAPHWFTQGGAEDSLEGRFGVLASVAALMLVRLERNPDHGEAGAALTERIIEALDSELREMGIGDPTLGKQVRAMVGALAGRVEVARAAVSGDADWRDFAERCMHRGQAKPDAAVAHTASAAHALWQRLDAADDAALIEGKIG
ncbi:ubiquinol-cytochrome C chaperone family protein [Sphingomonas sp.]|uniref:ubiquinol-cytochrome C chaperone family protein n=1 Tax=Sphingomonas sp. TaxID=28214 RepID=UPI00286E27E2|nr:ubiquinol-cytochrome C chaperone family protein [Sphingomonas sp.]